jgi:mannose-6-phosphate isomerase-like protein (cupin superfamily)
MTRHLPGFICGLVLGAAVTAVGSGQGQSSAKVVLENARVRVRDVTFPPGPTAMHTHELAHVGIVIHGGTLVFKYPDGKSETAKLEAGSVGFRDANVTHAPMNPGTAPVRVIEVELK